MDRRTSIQLRQKTVLRLKKIQETLSETYDKTINKLLDMFEKKNKKEE